MSKFMIIKESETKKIKEFLKKMQIEPKETLYWCPHCKRRTLAKLAYDPRFFKSPKEALLVCAFCGSSDIEGYENGEDFNPSER